MERRELFGSLASRFKKQENTPNIIRPPYFEDENDFIENCVECDAMCVDACYVI